MSTKIIDNTRNCIVFPGQGSQFVGMGKGLFLSCKIYVEKANECFQDMTCKDSVFMIQIKYYLIRNHTQFTQPALYLINALSYLNHKESQEALPAIFQAIVQVNIMHYKLLKFLIFLMDCDQFKKREVIRQFKLRWNVSRVLGNVEDKLNNLLSASVEIANYNSHEQLVL